VNFFPLHCLGLRIDFKTHPTRSVETIKDRDGSVLFGPKFYPFKRLYFVISSTCDFGEIVTIVQPK